MSIPTTSTRLASILLMYQNTPALLHSQRVHLRGLGDRDWDWDWDWDRDRDRILILYILKA